ncbi:MAG: ABC transporter permease [Aestuariivirga sp.]|uniref:ABC transporter permease n=1 Tax=Aestuariivirga sp. TaxID=2650926 RepID=UPI0038D24301
MTREATANAATTWRRLQFFFDTRLHVRLESIIVLLALCVAMSVLSPFFLSVSNILNILLATSTIGVLAIGATLILSSNGLDLSLGSVLGFSGVVGAYLVVVLGMPWPFAIIGALAAGTLAGAVNGFLVTHTRIPAFIVTLGMLGIARGFALIIAPNGGAIYGLPAPVVFLGQGRPFGIPAPVIILLLTAIVAHYLLAYTRFGRHTLALGDNEAAARATGIPVERLRWKLYAISGFMAGLAGLIFMARVNAGDPTAGLNYELTAITAAIIGGTSLFGGKGSILGTMVGALIMGVLQNGLNLLAVPSFWQQVAIGVVLILAVYIDQLQTGKEKKA